MNTRKILIITAGALLFASCASIFNGAVLPNQCRKCEVVNTLTNEILWSVEGCGSENTGLEDKAKIQAYDLSRSGYNLCNLEVRTTTWKKEQETAK